MQFLKGLNKKYSNFRSNILMMNPLPAISKVFSYMVQQKRQSLNLNMLNSVINAASTSSNSISCSSYGKDNHTVENCYKKNGFPSNFSSARVGRTLFGSGRGNGGRNGKICTHYGITGHTI